MSKKKTWTKSELEKLYALKLEGLLWKEIIKHFPGSTENQLRKAFYNNLERTREVPESLQPKVLLFDIETAPMEVYAWGLFDQTIGLEQIIKDWSVLSFSAKWLGKPGIIYHDTSKKKDPRDDSDLVKIIHSLLDEADIVIVQNGIRFDIPKLNARFFKHKLQPPSSYRVIDTYRIARAKFGFTSNKLAYMTDNFCESYKKLEHGKFPGFKMWKECLAGNKAAWKEMKEYNEYDVLSMEELYLKMAPWDKTINFGVYTDDLQHRCTCGSTELKHSGYHYTNRAKYKKFKCTVCGKEHRDKENLLSKEKRKSLKV
jgi:hypothetical protein